MFPLTGSQQSVPPVFLSLFASWVSFHYFCPMLVPWMSKKLKVISPLLIVLANRGEIHWVLAILPFIQGLCLTHFNKYEEMQGSPTNYSGVWGILIHPPIRTDLSPFHSFIGRTLPGCRLSYVCHDLGSILRIPISKWFDHLCVSTTRVEKHQTCLTWWKCIKSTSLLQE